MSFVYIFVSGMYRRTVEIRVYIATVSIVWTKLVFYVYPYSIESLVSHIFVRCLCTLLGFVSFRPSGQKS